MAGTHLLHQGTLQAIWQIPHFGDHVREAAVSHQWKFLGRTRYNFSGLQAGWSRTASSLLKNPRMQNKLRMILTDGVYTPWRAHQACGADPTCPLCGHDKADFERLV